MKILALCSCLLLLACASASAQLISTYGCLDNCGSYTGDCTACHKQEGPETWFSDYTSVCGSCSEAVAKVTPKVPFQANPTDTVLAFLDALTIKRDPKLARIMAMTPEKHIERMQRAVRLKLDGPMLGSCSHAFKVGTLALLPAEIDATIKRLMTARLIERGAF